VMKRGTRERERRCWGEREMQHCSMLVEKRREHVCKGGELDEGVSVGIP
jgi:hypothetical protein